MILGDMLASSPPTEKCSELVMTLMTNKLKFPDGVTITATISPATEEILVPEAIVLIAALHQQRQARFIYPLKNCQKNKKTEHANTSC